MFSIIIFLEINLIFWDTHSIFLVSNIRREDYKMIFDDSKEFVDVIQCNNAPSTRTPRGHQFPAAFMHHVSKHKSNRRKCHHLYTLKTSI